MFFSGQRARFFRSLPCWISLSLGIAIKDSAQAQTDKKMYNEGMLAVHLTDESKASLTSYLKKRGVLDGAWVPPSSVTLKSRMDTIDHYVYSPMYGERVAFRLKGLLKSSDGADIVGIGRVSNMNGEIFDDDFEVSVVLKTRENSTEGAQAMMDMPTLLFRSLVAASQWGNENVPSWETPIPGGEVLGKTYAPREGITIEKLAPDVQLVIDGHLCSSKYIDEKGLCTFEKADIPGKVPQEAMRRRELMEQRALEHQQEASEDEESCSVCRFMKRGPCGAEFKEWDECMQGLKEEDDLKKCFGLTVAMMNCMRKHEYYDIMTTNSETKMEQMNSTTDTSSIDSAPEKPGKAG